MGPSDNVGEMRADIQRLRRAATRKISRLKTQHNVLLSGTRIDPRRKPQQHKTYTRKQLKAYRDELQRFVSRETQYVSDSSNRPIPAKEWRAYKRAEGELSKSVQERFARVAGLKMPSGETLAERMAKMTPDHPTLSGASSRQFYRPAQRSPMNVKSRAALAKLLEDARRKSDPKYFDRLTKKSRKQFSQMVDMINEPELKKLANQLSDMQFAALWHYGGLPTAVGLPYELMMSMLSDQDKPWHSKVIADSMSEAYALIKNAKKWKI